MSLPEEERRTRLLRPPDRFLSHVARPPTLVTSAQRCTAGIIGWFGLRVPHLARSLVGPDFARCCRRGNPSRGYHLLSTRSLAPWPTSEITLGILDR